MEESQRLWAGESVDEATPDDVRELLSYRAAFNLVSESLSRGEPMSEVGSGPTDPGRHCIAAEL